MAVDTQAFRLLLAARKAGADFSQTVTFGRQCFFPKRSHVARELSRANLGITEEAIGEMRHCYAERFFQALGAQKQDSIDASAYEGATIVHDLNLPVPAELRGKYTLVYDGGTSEHVFNYPQTLANAMRLLAVGGHFVTMTAGNNLSGHGFYQVSPELFFRVFSGANGFGIVAVLLADARAGGPFFRVADPASAKERIEFVSARPYLVAAIARKVEDVAELQAAPRQSDYQRAWENPAGRNGQGKLVREVRRVLRGTRRHLGRWFYLPWQSKGITHLSGSQLYGLR
jgi:hypothetical protein